MSFSSVSQKPHDPLHRIRDDVARARFACDAVCFALGRTESLLLPTRGNPDVAIARQLAMYLTHVGFGMSLSRVAVAFGRDRSTVAHACRQIEDRRDDMVFDDMVSALEQAVRGAPPPGSARRLFASAA
jgi:hypothetical protein